MNARAVAPFTSAAITCAIAVTTELISGTVGGVDRIVYVTIILPGSILKITSDIGTLYCEASSAIKEE